MKTPFLKVIACLCLSAIIFSCSKEEKIEPDLQYITLKLTGELIKVDYSPLTRASSNDLYGISVLKGGQPYASGIVDDASNLSLQLAVDGSVYTIMATIIKDGKTKLFSSNSIYGLPFNAPLGSGIAMNNSFSYAPLKTSTAKLSDGKEYNHPDIERYYGAVTIDNPAQNEVSIEMKRMSFGAEFIATGANATSGTLEISLDGAPALSIPLTENGENTAYRIYTMAGDLSTITENSTETIPVTFNYKATNGENISLGTHNIDFMRNKKTTVTLQLNNVSLTNNISLSIADTETGNMEQGNSVTITDGIGEYMELDADFPTTHNLDFNSHSLTIPIKTNVEYTYETSNSDWIKFENKTTSGDIDNIEFYIKANTTSENRSGTIVLSNANLGVTITINVTQNIFTGIDDSSLDMNKYLTYVKNHDSKTEGDAFDADITHHRSHFYASFNNCTKAEYKFMLASLPSSTSEIALSSSSGSDRSHRAILLTDKGLQFYHYDDDDGTDTVEYTWEQLGIAWSDVITLTLDSQNDLITVNGTTINADVPFAILTPYLFSSYYNDRDDGEYTNYYGFIENSRLYYVKAWETSGKLLYLGHASTAKNTRTGNIEACWKSSSYYNGNLSTNTEFAHYCTNLANYSPFGKGNL